MPAGFDADVLSCPLPSRSRLAVGACTRRAVARPSVVRGDDVGLNTLLDSRIARRVSALSMLGEAVLSWSRGDRRLGVLFLVVSVLAYRWSALGVFTETGIRLSRRVR